MMLYKLLSRLDRSIYYPYIVSLTDRIPLAIKFSNINISVDTLGMNKGVPTPHGFVRLIKILRDRKTDLIQSWLYHADLIGGLASIFAGRVPVVWNIRHNNLSWSLNKKSTVFSAYACALLSYSLPKKTISCAVSAINTHVKIGYDPSKMIVIPNGFDLSLFNPDRDARIKLCRELNLPENSLIIGLVSRYHPQKDHFNFINAAEILKKSTHNVHFVLCGDGVTWENNDLVRQIRSCGLQDSFHLLGPRSDIARITSSFDIATSSSCGEAFSNTIGEAMACGVPCVVTDVGDSAFIVGKTGKVVSPSNSVALANAWNELHVMGEEGRRQLGAAARQRVVENFSLEVVVQKYQDLYDSILSARC